MSCLLYVCNCFRLNVSFSHPILLFCVDFNLKVFAWDLFDVQHFICFLLGLFIIFLYFFYVLRLRFSYLLCCFLDGGLLGVLIFAILFNLKMLLSSVWNVPGLTELIKCSYDMNDHIIVWVSKESSICSVSGDVSVDKLFFVMFL